LHDLQDAKRFAVCLQRLSHERAAAKPSGFVGQTDGQQNGPDAWVTDWGASALPVYHGLHHEAEAPAIGPVRKAAAKMPILQFGTFFRHPAALRAGSPPDFYRTEILAGCTSSKGACPPATCKVLGGFRTKMFHVKHF